MYGHDESRRTFLYVKIFHHKGKYKRKNSRRKFRRLGKHLGGKTKLFITLRAKPQLLLLTSFVSPFSSQKRTPLPITPVLLRLTSGSVENYQN